MKRSKGYNPIKLRQIQYPKMLSRVWLGKVSKNPELLRGGIDYDMPDVQHFINYLLHQERPWTVWMGVFQEPASGFGKPWVDAEIYTVTNPVRPSDLADYLTERLAELKNSRNAKGVISEAWYAVPYATDFSERGDEIEALMVEHGAYGDYKFAERANVA